MRIVSRTAVWIVSAAAWSCGGSITAVDRPAGGVAAIAVTPTSITLVVGADAPLQATVRDASGLLLPGATVVWSVKDSTIASVSPAGVVSAHAVGNTQVAASAGGQSAIAAVAVQQAPVGSVTVLPTSTTVTRGQTVALSATVKDSRGTVVTDRVVTWTSSRNDVAIVSTAGLVTGVAPGSALIVATSEGVADTATVTVVKPAIASVGVQPSPASVQVGATVALTATVVDESGAVVTGEAIVWSSSNVAVATVSSSGVVTGHSAGSATVAATSGGKSGSSTVTVTPVPVARLSLAPDSLTLAPGATVTLTASTLAADGTVLAGRTITFSSDNSGVARVSSAGVVTGVAAGSAVITATSEGKSATVKVVVRAPVADVTLTPSSLSLRQNRTVQLSAVALDADGNVLTGRVFTWTSSNSQVASVNGSGVVTTNRTGTTTITVTVEGRSATTRITVTD